MPTVEALRKQAQALGITGTSSLKKAELEAAIAAAEAPPSGDDEPEAPEAEDVESEGAEGDVEPLEGDELQPPGVVTEPERGGLLPEELAGTAAAEPPTAGPQEAPASTGSITGAFDKTTGAGVPTEPDRGGLSDLERSSP